MIEEEYAVVVGAGSYRSSDPAAISFPHRWTSEGVTVESPFTGAHLLHLAAAGCVLNDLYREAAGLGLTLAGVRVSASGGFAADSWTSTGITYRVDLDAPAMTPEQREQLLAVVDEVAEIPRAIRQGAPVQRG
jgi:uncharacterized OsmC-like protein